jgi:transposase
MDDTDAKLQFLRKQRSFHAGHGKVSDPLFRESGFFDPRDLVLVKYEMLRKVRLEGCSVSTAARLFGLSRTVYYEALWNWQTRGLVGLLAERPGPRGPHKMTEEVVGYLQSLLFERDPISAAALVEHLQRERGIVVHPRTIEKALMQRKKGG